MVAVLWWNETRQILIWFKNNELRSKIGLLLLSLSNNFITKRVLEFLFLFTFLSFLFVLKNNVHAYNYVKYNTLFPLIVS